MKMYHDIDSGSYLTREYLKELFEAEKKEYTEETGNDYYWCSFEEYLIDKIDGGTLEECEVEEDMNTIKAMEAFKNAMWELSEAWEADSKMDSLKAMNMYPFEKSFDEMAMEVSNWINSMIEEMEDK